MKNHGKVTAAINSYLDDLDKIVSNCKYDDHLGTCIVNLDIEHLKHVLTCIRKLVNRTTYVGEKL